jgi:hypothetical protein
VKTSIRAALERCETRDSPYTSRVRLFTLLIIAFACLSGLAGCGSKQVAAGVAFDAPPDFTVDLAVLSDEPKSALKPVHERSARYVLTAEGVLRASFGDDLTPADFPPYTRTLTRDQLNAVWNIVAELRLDVPREGDAVGNVMLVERQRGSVTWLAAVTADGREAVARDVAPIGEAPDPALRTLTRTLAALAFASDAPDYSRMIVPIRYDFGPDPYARYRADE